MSTFIKRFGIEPSAAAHAPGRVNLLGDHTDYNDGFVLPIAIRQLTTVAIAPSGDGFHHFHSAQLQLDVRFAADTNPPPGFGQYVHGCIEVLRARRLDVEPLRVCIDSDVPVGAGLSSSAALEVATLRALRDLYHFKFDDVKLALFAQQAEIEFAGVNCGIMDQMASSLATTERMLLIDTRSLEARQLTLPAGAEVLIVDSGVARTLAGSAYNERRAECEEASRRLGVRALRDVSSAAVAAVLPAPLDARARHVISENSRVIAAAQSVSAMEFGLLMNASHASLRDDYEVSAVELDYLVARLQENSDVYGARMTGAGFGGACVALVRSGSKRSVAQSVIEKYQKNFNTRATSY